MINVVLLKSYLDGTRSARQHCALTDDVRGRSSFISSDTRATRRIGAAALEAGSRPHIRFYRDTKITIIDERRKVFVIDLLRKETCDLIRWVR